jgi:hypothetical protein
MFEVAYKWRVQTPQYFKQDIVMWRTKYLKEGVVNESGHLGWEQ